jgi:energy-coupling factor transporter ATP-binding protein EcfA2
LLSLVFGILDDAQEYLRELIHTNESKLIDYYEQMRTAEEYVVARAIYCALVGNIQESHLESFFRLLYSAFRVFDDFATFKQRLVHPNCFVFEQIQTVIHSAILELTQSSIMADHIVHLYELMLRQSCIIICGRALSGKSRVVQLLAKLFVDLSQNVDFVNRFPGIRPFKVLDLFHDSDVDVNIYGGLQQDSILGRVQIYGQIHAFLTDLLQYEATDHCILRFNGPLTWTLVTFLQEAVGQKGTIRMNSLGTIKLGNSFHFFVETDSLDTLSRAPLARSGLLLINDLCNVNHDFRSIVPGQYFSEIVTEVVKYVSNVPSLICSPETDSLSSDARILIKELLPMRTAEYAVAYLDSVSPEETSIEVIRAIIVHPPFAVFSSILDEKGTETFDNWLRSTFDVQLLKEWASTKIHDQFLDRFPRPSLRSMKVSKRGLVTLDFARLNLKPYVKPFERTRMLSDISIHIAEFLPAAFQAQILLDHKKHIILHGPRNSGKSTFLYHLTVECPDVVPAIVPCSELSTKESLLKFIALHSPTAVKDYILSKDDRTYALIFENVLPTHQRTLEVIRMIVSVGALPQVSRNDPKILDFIKLRNFVVLVTTESLAGFSNRFLSYFVPMRIAQYQKTTWKFIFEKVAESYGINPVLAICMFPFLYTLPDREFCVTQPLQIIGNLPEKTCESDEQSVRCLRSLLLELHFLYTHQLSPENKKKFVAMVGPRFSEATPFIDDVNFSNDIRLSGDMRRLSVGLTDRTNAKDRDETEGYLKECNAQSAEKIIHRLCDPIMRQYRMLLRAVTTPARSVLIQGASGMGKESMCRLIALRCEYDYTRLSSTNWQQQFGDALVDCIIHGRQGIVFVRQSEFGEADLHYLINFVQTVPITEILTVAIDGSL